MSQMLLWSCAGFCRTRAWIVLGWISLPSEAAALGAGAHGLGQRQEGSDWGCSLGCGVWFFASSPSTTIGVLAPAAPCLAWWSNERKRYTIWNSSFSRSYL